MNTYPWNRHLPHRSATNGITERAVRRITEGTSCCAVAIKSGLQMTDSMKYDCHFRNLQDLLSDGKHFTDGDLANCVKDQQFRLVRWSNITLFLPKTCRGCIRKSYQEVFLGFFMASEINAKRLNAREMLTPRNGDCFLDRRWNNQAVWRRSSSNNIHQNPSAT